MWGLSRFKVKNHDNPYPFFPKQCESPDLELKLLRFSLNEFRDQLVFVADVVTNETSSLVWQELEGLECFLCKRGFLLA